MIFSGLIVTVWNQFWNSPKSQYKTIASKPPQKVLFDFSNDNQKFETELLHMLCKRDFLYIIIVFLMNSVEGCGFFYYKRSLFMRALQLYVGGWIQILPPPNSHWPLLQALTAVHSRPTCTCHKHLSQKYCQDVINEMRLNHKRRKDLLLGSFHFTFSIPLVAAL